MMPKVFALKNSGADVIMPVILFELNKQMKAGAAIDLAEAYSLLNDTQAVYLTLASADNDAYYKQLEPTIRSLLAKYGLQWILIENDLSRYCERYAELKGFKRVDENVWSHATGEVEIDNYDRIMLRALLEECSATRFLESVDELIEEQAAVDEIDHKLDLIEDGKCSECGAERDPDVDDEYMCLSCRMDSDNEERAEETYDYHVVDPRMRVLFKTNDLEAAESYAKYSGRVCKVQHVGE